MSTENYREISLLMGRMRRLGSLAANQRLSVVGSSLYEYKVLLRLVHDTEVAQHELAFDAAMDKAAVSRLIRTLEAQGIVSVRVHPSDRRQRLVKLTKKGRAKEAMLAPILDEALAPFMGGLTEREEAEFLRLLRKACDACTRAASEPKPEPRVARKPRR